MFPSDLKLMTEGLQRISRAMDLTPEEFVDLCKVKGTPFPYDENKTVLGAVPSMDELDVALKHLQES